MASVGPIELVVIGFDGNEFTGDVAPALLDLVDRGIVRIIDLAVIVKDGDGNGIILEHSELDGPAAAAMAVLKGSEEGLLSEADLEELAQDMAAGTTVAAILFEHVWATAFADAVRAAGGGLLLSERIPGDIVEAARASLAA